MPYTSEWIPPEVALEHGGVTVYPVYKEDDYAQGPRRFQFSLVMEAGELEDGTFDVRDLSNWRPADHPPYLTGANDTEENWDAWQRWYQEGVEDRHIMDTLKVAIGSGLLPEAAE